MHPNEIISSHLFFSDKEKKVAKVFCTAINWPITFFKIINLSNPYDKFD